MRLQRLLMVTAAVLMLASVAASQGNRSPEARLRAAMDKETVDGDLKAAIDGYTQVISQRGASREVVAMALLRLGMAYEKRADVEARKPYERLVNEYGDQPAVVQQARARMAVASVPAAPGPTIRRICAGTDCAVGEVREGRWKLSVANNQLTISDLMEGKRRVIAEAPAGGGICCAAMSPDRKRIVYTLRIPVGVERHPEIVVADIDGRNPRTVSRGATFEAWSPDGRRVLAAASDQNARVRWISVGDSTAQPIPTSGWEDMDIFRVSPDGKSIAFSGNKDASSENVYVMSSDGSGETRVSPDPSYQEPVGWSSDGRHLLYMQNAPRGSGQGPTLWSVSIANGRVQGPPVAVRQFEPRTIILDLSSTGTLYYRTISSINQAEIWAMDNFLPSGR